MDNAAALVTEPGPAPAPSSVTYNNPAAPWPAVILTLAAVVPFGCVILWWTGVYVLDTAGYVQPDKALAKAIIATIGAVAVLAFVAVLSIVAGRAFLSDVLDHRERMKQLDLDIARHRQLTAQAPVPSGRVMSEDQRFVRVLEAVMFNAYDHLASHGEFAGAFRPWSRRGVLSVQLADGTRPTEREAGDVRPWLVQRGVVKHDQVNAGKYPDLASFQELLYREYDRPVVVQPAPALRDNAGYQHI